MATQSVDQILKVVLPTRAGSDSAPHGQSAEGARFQEHLQRASATEENSGETPATTTETEEPESAVDTDQQHDGSSSENQVEESVVEGEEAHAQPIENPDELLDVDDILQISQIAQQVSQFEEPDEPVELSAEIPTDISETHDSDDLSDEHGEGSNAFSKKLVESSVETTEPIITTKPEPQLAPQPEATREVPSTSDEQIASPTETTTTSQIPEAPSNSEIIQVTTDAPAAPLVTSEKESPIEVSPTLEAQTAAELPEQPLTDNPKSETSPATPKKADSPSESLTSDITQKLERELAATAPLQDASSPTPNTTEPNPHSDQLLSTEKTASTNPIDQAASNTEPSNDSETTPTVDRARFVQRVSGAIRAAKDQDGLVQLKLSPPELGSLRIEITVKQGALTAQLETETVAARNLLLDNLPALRDRLAEQEIRIEKFDVDVRQEGQPQQENPGAEDRRPTQSGPDNRRDRNPDSTEPQESTASILQQSTPVAEQVGGLDVRI